MKLPEFQTSDDRVREFCLANGIARLSLFGSVLRADFGAESDVDCLVEFQPGKSIGLFEFAGMQQLLTELMGRQVHLHTLTMLPPGARDRIAAGAKVQYAA